MTDQMLAEELLRACLDAGHKPGKVQFTKYLYLLDYASLRMEGRRASSLPWKFYHFGPWCEEVEGCMSGLAARYGFSWRENEFAVVRDVQIPAISLGIAIKGLIHSIVQRFKDADVNEVLEVAYNQTEPMIHAIRGDRLEFSQVPYDKTRPMFLTKPTKAKPQTDYQIPESIRARMMALRERAKAWNAQSSERRAFRESPVYQDAVSKISEELGSREKLPPLWGSMTADAAIAMGRD